jgi:hypothetical protein
LPRGGALESVPSSRKSTDHAARLGPSASRTRLPLEFSWRGHESAPDDLQVVAVEEPIQADLVTEDGDKARLADFPVFAGDVAIGSRSFFAVGVSTRAGDAALAAIQVEFRKAPAYAAAISALSLDLRLIPWFRYQRGKAVVYDGCYPARRKNERTGLLLISRDSRTATAEETKR